MIMIKRSTMRRTHLKTVDQIRYWTNKSVDQTLFCLGTGFRRDLTRRLAGYIAAQTGKNIHTAKQMAREILATAQQKRLERLSQSIVMEALTNAVNDTDALPAAADDRNTQNYAIAA